MGSQRDWPPTNSAEARPNNSPVNQGPTVSSRFGSWMLVERNKRKPNATRMVVGEEFAEVV